MARYFLSFVSCLESFPELIFSPQFLVTFFSGSGAALHWCSWKDRQGMKRGPKKAWPVQFQHVKVLGFACCVVLGTLCGVFSPLSFVLNFYVDQLSEVGWCLSCHWCIRGISCHICWTLAVLCLVGLFLYCLILAKVEVGWETFQTKMMTLVEEEDLRFFPYWEFVLSDWGSLGSEDFMNP